MENKYNPDDVIILGEYASGKMIRIDRVTDTPRFWHTADKQENGNWKVSVEHKGGRVAIVELTDENYKKYGIDKLEPTLENPFLLEYRDEDMVQVAKAIYRMG